MSNGPGCTVSEDVADSTECSFAAASLGYSDTVTSGSWNTGPKGCVVGYPSDDYAHTYFNNKRGQTGRTIYKSICKQQNEG